MKFLIYAMTLFGILGCSSVNVKSNVDQNILTLKKLYVRSTVDKSIQKYRKINRAKIIVFNETIISANSHDGLVAYDKKTGNQIWRFFVNFGVEKEPVLFKNRLYFGANDGFVYCIDAVNGQEIWKSYLKSEIVSTGSFDAQEGRLYFLTSGNTISALDAESGKISWSYTRQDPSNYSIRGGTQPLISGNLLYVGFSEGSFVAFNKSNGTINWEIQLNKNKRFKDIDSTAVVDKDKIFVSGYDDKLYVLSSLNGEILKQYPQGTYVPIVIQDGTIFLSTSGGLIQALDQVTLNKKWSLELANGLGSELTVYDKYILAGESSGDLLVIDKSSGEIVSRFEPGRGIMSPIAVDPVEKSLYFISGEANLYKIGVLWKKPNLFSFTF